MSDEAAVNPEAQRALRRARSLAERLLRGEPLGEPIFEAAIELLDEHDEDLTPEARAFLDELRFSFHELATLRASAPRARVMERVVAAASKLA